MLEHLTNAKLQLALAGALTVVLVSLMIPVAICVRGFMVPVHACTQAVGLVSHGWHKQHPWQASTVAAGASVSCPMRTGGRVLLLAAPYQGEAAVASFPTCAAAHSPWHIEWHLAGLAHMAGLAQAVVQLRLLPPRCSCQLLHVHGLQSHLWMASAGSSRHCCRAGYPSAQPASSHHVRTAGPRCVQAAEQAGYTCLPHLDMQSASSTDEDIEADHRVHGAAALLPCVSPSAAEVPAQPESALEEMGHVERRADSSEQQKHGRAQACCDLASAAAALRICPLLQAHLLAVPPIYRRRDSMRPQP